MYLFFKIQLELTHRITPEQLIFIQFFKKLSYYSKTCLKRNTIVLVFFFPFSQVSVLQRVVF